MKIVVCRQCGIYPAFKSFVVDNNLLAKAANHLRVKAVDDEVPPILKESDDLVYDLTHHAELVCERCGLQVSEKSSGYLVNKEKLITKWNNLNDGTATPTGRTLH